jgi:hypothetical protein
MKQIDTKKMNREELQELLKELRLYRELTKELGVR